MSKDFSGPDQTRFKSIRPRSRAVPGFPTSSSVVCTSSPKPRALRGATHRDSSWYAHRCSRERMHHSLVKTSAPCAYVPARTCAERRRGTSNSSSRRSYRGAALLNTISARSLITSTDRDKVRRRFTGLPSPLESSVRSGTSNRNPSTFNKPICIRSGRIRRPFVGNDTDGKPWNFGASWYGVDLFHRNSGSWRNVERNRKLWNGELRKCPVREGPKRRSANSPTLSKL